MARPQNSYSYPFATSPDIIRSHQKDAYFQGVLLEQLLDILRQTRGTRFTHNFATEIRTTADLLYHGLTTFLGNRTLGEEYCDIVQVEQDTRKLPKLSRRSGYILCTILIPYALNKLTPRLRRRMRSTLETTVRKPSNSQGRDTTQWVRTIRTYLLDNIDTLTSPAPIYAVSLAIFYFSGAYYQLGKRIWGLRYIFTRDTDPSDQRAGYEVLGVLLVLQLSVQAYMHMRTTVSNEPNTDNIEQVVESSAVVGQSVNVSLDPQAYTSNNALLFDADEGTPAGGVKKGKLEKMLHTPVPTEPIYQLKDRQVMQWMPTKQQRKCTLCLEELKDPSITTCGHMFCWVCIGDWLRERPECPLCRSHVLLQHVLPLRE